MILQINIVLAQCYTVAVETFPLNPQTGQHNYFGVRVTVQYPFNENIAVNGYVYDDGAQNTNNPFSLTIQANELSAETSVFFYQTDPTATAIASISSVNPCPFNEAIVGVYSANNQVYTLNISNENEAIINELKTMYSDQSLTIDSITIDDDDPYSIDSASYLIFYGSSANNKFALGLLLSKANISNNIFYTVSNEPQSTEANRQSIQGIESAWECKKNSVCLQCKGHRNWFMGPVRGCDCLNSGTNDCIFQTSGTGIP